MNASDGFEDIKNNIATDSFIDGVLSVQVDESVALCVMYEAVGILRAAMTARGTARWLPWLTV